MSIKTDKELPLKMTSYNDYEKYIRTIPRRTMEQYKSNPLLYPKNYIDIKVAFYGLFSYQPQAWDIVLKELRKYYPTEPFFFN